MSKIKTLAVAACMLAPFALHAEPTGDAAEGARNFQQCVSCHGIADPDGNVIHRVRPTGPNLWGVVGRQAGSYEGYTRFSAAMVAAGAEHGLVWDETSFVAFLQNPAGYLREVTGDARARSNMNHRLQGSAEDIYAYLASLTD